MSFVCVECGNGISGAVKGSMKHPYCGGCWTRVWHDDYVGFKDFLAHEHERR